MNSLSRIIRYIFSAILLGGIIALLRYGASWSARPAADADPSRPGGAKPLFRDPSCGTFVSPEISFPATRAGEVQHFCSEQCRDRYLRSDGFSGQRGAVSARSMTDNRRSEADGQRQ